MKVKKFLGISNVEGVRKIEFSIERVAVWTMIFTNAYFIYYFFVKLLNRG
jgi:hypothetical protein